MRLYTLAPVFALAALVSGPAEAVLHSNRQVAVLQIDNRPCLFFRLKDVPEADPVFPGVPFFALSTTTANYQTYASILVSSKLTGQPIYVETDGTLSCGHPTVSLVGLN